MIRWPLPGPFAVTSGFGKRKRPKKGASVWHNGIDIGAPIGTDVLAAHRGAWWPSYNAKGGNQVVVQGDGVRTGYAHLRTQPEGSVPQYAGMPAHVSGYAFPGSKIGEVGNTGVSTGPHLHFTAKKNGEFVDPRTLMAGASREKTPPDGGIATVNNAKPPIPAFSMNGMMGFRRPDGSVNWQAGSPIWQWMSNMGTGILSAPEGSSAVQMFGRGVQQGNQFMQNLPRQQMQQALMGLQMQKLQGQMGGNQNLAAIINRLPPNHPARVAYAAGDFKGAADILYKLSPEYIKSRAAISAAGRTTITNTVGGNTYKPQGTALKNAMDKEHAVKRLAEAKAAGDQGGVAHWSQTIRRIDEQQGKAGRAPDAVLKSQRGLASVADLYIQLKNDYRAVTGSDIIQSKLTLGIADPQSILKLRQTSSALFNAMREATNSGANLTTNEVKYIKDTIGGDPEDFAEKLLRGDKGFTERVNRALSMAERAYHRTRKQYGIKTQSIFPKWRQARPLSGPAGKAPSKSNSPDYGGFRPRKVR